MPKESTIPVSKNTLKMIKDFKKEFGHKSLDKAVEDSIRWARAFSYIEVEQRRTMMERINDLEFRIEALEKLVKVREENKNVNRRK